MLRFSEPHHAGIRLRSTGGLGRIRRGLFPRRWLRRSLMGSDNMWRPSSLRVATIAGAFDRFKSNDNGQVPCCQPFGANELLVNPAGPVIAPLVRVEFRAEVLAHPEGRFVRLAGRLASQHTSALESLCDDGETAVRLDLADLISADAVGFDTLCRLRSRGAELVGASPYVAMQLEIAQRGRGR